MKNNQKKSDVKERTYQLLLSTALTMFEEGKNPTITELANQAGVGRATAYRYFPSQKDLIDAVVDESLGPILSWQPKQESATNRVVELLEFAYPQMMQHEGALRAAIQLSLQQWADNRANELKTDERFVRGHRRNLLALATEPLAGEVSDKTYTRLQHALSVVYGSEIFLVLKDIWGLELDEVQDVAQWMVKALIAQAEAEKAEKN